MPATGARRSGCRRWISTQLGQRLDENVRGREHLDAALANGRGAVAALPHSGNWDMAGVWMTQTYGKFTTVAERLKPESLYRRFVEYRESLGFEVIPLSGGEQPPFPLLSRTAAGQQICVSDGRAGSQSQRRPGQFLRRTDQDAGRPGEAGDHHRGGAAARALLVRRRRLPSHVLPAAGLQQRRCRRRHPGAGRRVRPQHRRASRRLAHAPAAVAGGSVRRAPGPIGGSADSSRTARGSRAV